MFECCEKGRGGCGGVWGENEEGGWVVQQFHKSGEDGGGERTMRTSILGVDGRGWRHCTIMSSERACIAGVA